jgi:predicted nucleic acid-binding protein
VSRRWIIDASVALAWAHPAQASPRTDRLLTELKRGITLLVPSLWFLEIANALLVLERRKKLKPAERQEALARLAGLSLESDSEGALLALSKLSELAQRHNVTVYDATYLELALRTNLPLGTKDSALHSAAEACGIDLLIS